MIAMEELAKRIGADSVVWMPFDGGAQIGVGAYWGERRHAVSLRFDAAREPTDDDFLTAADMLKVWWEGQS